jgi:hypothetical protein
MRARARPGPLDRLLEQGPGPADVASVEVVFGCLNLALDDSLAIHRRGQPLGQLGQFCGRLRRSPGAGKPGRLVELSRDLGIGSGRSQREVPGAFLLVIHVLSEAAVNGAALGRRCYPVAG